LLIPPIVTLYVNRKVLSSLEKYFSHFREGIIGIDQTFQSPFGVKKIIYTDWTASGRLYAPIEEKMLQTFGPFVANTHTETNITGTTMTHAYHEARHIIKQHVNASKDDNIIAFGSGMTGVVNKFQRILGFRLPEQFRKNLKIAEDDRPVVFVTHMEHHSNQTSWLETIANVEVINPDERGLVNINSLTILLKKYTNRKTKIAAITSCSNVTGIATPYHQIAKMMHEAGGVCFVDFACSAPYQNINMHPANPLEKLDAIYFSPHKFLGGPGTPGILIFDGKLYSNEVPDNPGGGTVKWTNPWKEHSYIDSIEDREDGGTPPFLQTIKAALCIKLKEEMGAEKMLTREKEILEKLFPRLKKIKGLHLLAENIDERLAVISFYIDDLHYNLGVKILNDRFGIQVRGGCSCAGTYGHYLLHVSEKQSHEITEHINHGDLSSKPGWIRLSLHPTTTDEEVAFIGNAIEELVKHFSKWEKDYHYDPHTNEYECILETKQNGISDWFELKKNPELINMNN
jgi:selenocysteine lyase/cysteine desulfurase